MLGAFTGSSVFMVGLIAAMRFATADGGDFLSQGNEEDRLNDLRNFVNRQQERQQPPPEPEQKPEDSAEAGGTGQASAGEVGKMGKRDSTQSNRRFAIKNNNEPPHLSKQQMEQRATTAGILAAFGRPVGAQGGASGITSPWGQATESGLDNVNANGNMHGGEIGEALGAGGLGAVGTGFGGGGSGLGSVGMGGNGFGHGSGTGSGDGIGGGTGASLRERPPPRPSVRPAAPAVSGGLTADAIRRVVRSNIGQIEHCHSLGLTQNPNLAGRVTVSFAIGPDGRVVGSSLGGSSVSVPAVTSCIVAAVRRWHFQQPEGGVVVRVSYPFDLRVD
jgi:TonB family protein